MKFPFSRAWIINKALSKALKSKKKFATWVNDKVDIPFVSEGMEQRMFETLIEQGATAAIAVLGGEKGFAVISKRMIAHAALDFFVEGLDTFLKQKLTEAEKRGGEVDLIPLLSGDMEQMIYDRIINLSRAVHIFIDEKL